MHEAFYISVAGGEAVRRCAAAAKADYPVHPRRAPAVPGSRRQKEGTCNRGAGALQQRSLLHGQGCVGQGLHRVAVPPGVTQIRWQGRVPHRLLWQWRGPGFGELTLCSPAWVIPACEAFLTKLLYTSLGNWQQCQQKQLQIGDVVADKGSGYCCCEVLCYKEVRPVLARR